MNVYEIGFEGDEGEHVVWIATDRKLKFTKVDPDMYCKLIEDYDKETPGVDLVIT